MPPDLIPLLEEMIRCKDKVSFRLGDMSFSELVLPILKCRVDFHSPLV
ncbi:MAG: hypothetical protein P4L27_11810 [Ignavibacteriaceae bacterium]|nr:hypothetical protein [Ignavibacteriaceae bacterium]